MENDVVDKLNVEKTPEEILKQYYSVIDKIIKLQNQIEPGLDNDFTQLVELQGQEQRLRFQLSQYGKYGKELAEVAISYKRAKIGKLAPTKAQAVDWKQTLKECYKQDQAQDRKEIAELVAKEVELNDRKDTIEKTSVSSELVLE